jgi:hypothetical protein
MNRLLKKTQVNWFWNKLKLQNMKVKARRDGGAIQVPLG